MPNRIQLATLGRTILVWHSGCRVGLRAPALEVEWLVIQLRQGDGVEVLGALTVRNVTITEDEWFRIGGETAWAETSWLYRYTTLAMVPDFKRKRSPIPIFSV